MISVLILWKPIAAIYLVFCITAFYCMRVIYLLHKLFFFPKTDFLGQNNMFILCDGQKYTTSSIYAYQESETKSDRSVMLSPKFVK